MTADERTVHTERIKLTANPINTVGIAILISGAVLPMISGVYGVEAPKTRFWLLIQ